MSRRCTRRKAVRPASMASSAAPASAAEATSARLTLRMTSPDCRPPASAARSSAGTRPSSATAHRTRVSARRKWNGNALAVPDSSRRRWISMTEPGQPRGRTLAVIRGAHRQGRCARMSPMNGRYESVLDRHTPQPTLPCSCSTTARNGCGARRGVARHPYGFHAGAPARSAASSRRRMSSGVRIDAPPLPVHSRGDVLDPLEAPSAIGPILAGHLTGQRGQVDAQRRPTRGHLDPALVTVAELHARAMDQ